MIKDTIIAEIKRQLEYAQINANTDYDHARNYAYKVVCEHYFDDGTLREKDMCAARFHDGRHKGHNVTITRLQDLLKFVESLSDIKPKGKR